MFHAPTLFAVLTMVCIFVAVLVAIAWRGEARYAGMRAVKYGLSLLAAGFLIQGVRSADMPGGIVTA
ncbi:hypothetical protein ABTL71_19515, partial [Acinetobacter baumannii]